MTARDFTLVLGGGGMRGIAHIGVLRALQEADLTPREVVGSSIGAVIAAAWCSGMKVEEATAIALDLRRRDLFQIAHRDMALKRMQSPALYRREPLAHFVTGILGDLTFDELPRTLLINTVDINSGTQVFWGAPGLRDVRVSDAVLASCALPGFLPPHEIRGRYYVDGAAAANLPVQILARGDRDLIVAVDAGGRPITDDVHREGFAAVYARAIQIGIQVMDEHTLQRWERPPVLLIRPRVWHVPLLSFQHNRELIREGYRAAKATLEEPNGLPMADARGVFPRYRYRVEVDRSRCVGCGACVVTGAPGLFALDGEGKARLTDPTPIWSAVDGVCVRQCPTRAIRATRLTD